MSRLQQYISNQSYIYFTIPGCRPQSESLASPDLVEQVVAEVEDRGLPGEGGEGGQSLAGAVHQHRVGRLGGGVCMCTVRLVLAVKPFSHWLHWPCGPVAWCGLLSLSHTSYTGHVEYQLGAGCKTLTTTVTLTMWTIRLMLAVQP